MPVWGTSRMEVLFFFFHWMKGRGNKKTAFASLCVWLVERERKCHFPSDLLKAEWVDARVMTSVCTRWISSGEWGMRVLCDEIWDHILWEAPSQRWSWRSNLCCSSILCTPLLQTLPACCAQMTSEIPPLLEAEWPLLWYSGHFKHWWSCLSSGNTLWFGMSTQNTSLGVVWCRGKGIGSKNPLEFKSSLSL